jgi:hypothetical protein
MHAMTSRTIGNTDRNPDDKTAQFIITSISMPEDLFRAIEERRKKIHACSDLLTTPRRLPFECSLWKFLVLGRSCSEMSQCSEGELASEPLGFVVLVVLLVGLK